MSTRIPPKGRPPQQADAGPPAMRGERRALAKDKPRRRGFDIVIAVVVVALVAVFANALIGSMSPSAYTGASMNPDGTADPNGGSADDRAAAGAPVISEIMASNSGAITAEDGNYYDWIELYNPTGRAISLAGFALSDNLKKPTKLLLPARTLEPGEYAIIYCTGTESTGTELHSTFKLKSSGQVLTLVDPGGRELQRITYPAMETNVSYAVDMADTGEWALTDEYTPGYANTGEGYAAFAATRRAVSDVVLSEVMAGNTLTIRDEDGEYSDWVEIYNGSDKAVDLAGWGLSDRESEPKRWVFPKVSVKPGEYLIVYVSGKNRAEEGRELHADFRLNGFKDTVMLSNLRGQIVSEISIDDLPSDASFGRVPGTGNWEVFTHPTPGLVNSEEGFNTLQPKLYETAGDEPVIISEVMSTNVSTLQDQFGEYPDWIELYNRSNEDVNLKGWGLTDKSDEPGRWKFPDVTIAAGERMVVFASERNLTDGDAAAKKKLHTDFNIGGDGAVIALTQPDGRMADRCLVPGLPGGVTYGRAGGDKVFSYSTSPTPGQANAGSYPGFAAEPVYSIKAGMYDTAQKVELTAGEGASVYYTLDGTTPTRSSTPYAGPIDIAKTTALRAVAYRDGYLPSAAVCSTYLINEGIGLPVVSIVTDPDNLFDEQTGIYVKGSGAEPDFPYQGANFWKDWERPAHVELIESDGTVGLNQDFGLKIYGQYSRGNDQKSFALIARGEYGENSFDYPIFPDLPYTSYKSFIVRNSAQDANMSRIRTSLQLGLAAETTELDIQSSRQGVVFVNGEFWGVYDIMEKINEHWLAQHHNLSPDQVDLLEGNGAVKSGSNAEYRELIDWVRTHDLSVQENYDYVASKIDIDSYIDWVTIEIYTVNSDLGNVRFWKPRTPEGKWRWILYDLDWGFFFANQEKYASYQDSFSEFLDPEGNGVGNNFDNSLIRGLLKNEGFKEKFIERFVYHCTTTFETNRVLQRIDELTANIEPYMQRDKDKWNNGTVERWKSTQIELLKAFARIRPEMNLHYMQQYFNLSDEKMNELLGK